MSTEPRDDISRSIERLAGALGATEALVRAGRAVDLAGLDAGVGAICADALGLPHTQGRACLPALRALLDRVGSLGTVMRDARPPD